MLNRLMRWTVFAHANRVMSKDINHRKFHDRCETQGTPSVVAEDQKSGAEYSELSECSRTPKWTFLAPNESRLISPAPSKVSRVFVDGERSAEPPISHGCLLAIAFNTLPEESLLAIPFASGGNFGIAASQPSGSSRC